MNPSFRPWCPMCEVTSEPTSRHCDTCGLCLYPSEQQLETLVAMLRRQNDQAELAETG